MSSNKCSRLLLFLVICFMVYLLHFLHNALAHQNRSTKEILWAALLVPVTGLTGLISYDIFRRQISQYHTVRSAFDHYVAITSLSCLGWYFRRKMDKATKDVHKSQETILLQRLKENSDTEYGRKYKFSDITSREDYVGSVPLTFISHYQPYIERMMKGEEKILTAKQPVIFAVTSGTSGKSSIIPMTGKQRLLFFVQGVAVAYHSMLQGYPDNKNLQKTIKFFYTPKWQTSEAGIPVGPNSSSPTNSKQLLNIYSTPKPGFDILSEPEALYVHLLFGLKDKKIGMLEANFASLVLSSFKALDVYWQDLVNDIEKGFVNPKLNIKDSVRDELNKILKPDKARAAELREAFETGTTGLARRIWPDCHVVLASDSGTFDLPASLLRESYCKGIPIYSPLYAASEGLLGLNIWPEKRPSLYLLPPESMFYEFIPIENSKMEQPKTLFMDQLEIGAEYELVITNVSGLYRYRFGDVVKVTGFYNQCPIIEFMYRQGQFLNVRGEKTSESSFYQTLLKVAESWPEVKLVDYCCAESLLDEGQTDGQSYSPYYHVFLEFENDNVALTEAQRNKLDESLCDSTYVYKSFRNKGSIRPMKVHIVKSGTFQQLRDFTIETTKASSNQYKIPRVLKKGDAFKFVMDRVKN